MEERKFFDLMMCDAHVQRVPGAMEGRRGVRAADLRRGPANPGACEFSLN